MAQPHSLLASLSQKFACTTSLPLHLEQVKMEGEGLILGGTEIKNEHFITRHGY